MSEPKHRQHKQADEPGLYVGYRPMPASVRMFIRFVAPLTITLLAVIAGVCAWGMASFADGSWDLSSVRTYRGTYLATPYPMLITSLDDEQGTHAIPVVSDLKFGVHERLEAYDGQVVELDGWPLKRSFKQQSRLMLALAPDAGAVRTLDDPDSTAQAPIATVLGDVEIEGELVDGKCYYGAMKPGEGKSHKSCAILCIDSGLPMMLAPTGASRDLVLVTGWRGTPMWDTARDLVAQRVVVRGELRRIANLEVLELGGVELR